MTPEELVRTTGIGPSKAVTLAAALELGRRLALPAAKPSDPIRRPADIAALVVPTLSRKRREHVLVVVLDRGSRPMRTVPISSGSVDRPLLPVREVLNAVLRCDGVAFALAHNHPSGDPSPSKEDVLVTQRIEDAAVAVGLKLLDHVIVAGGSWLSLRESGRVG